MFIPTKKRLGEILLEARLITQEQLQKALERQKQTNERLGKTLVLLGYIQEEQIVQCLEGQLGIPAIKLSKTIIEPEIAKLIPLNLAQRYLILPIKKTGSRLTLAMVDPLNILAMDDARMTTGLDVEPVIAMENELRAALARHFGLKDSIEKLMGDFAGQDDDTGEEMGLEQLKALVEDAPIVKIVNSLVQQAVQERASDVHVEPQEGRLLVRYRVDGVLREVTDFPKRMQAPIVSRLKIMAELDIAERRNPQDGRIQLIVADREIDVRMSTLPTIFGEKVVMRILDKSKGLFGLEDLQFCSPNLEVLTKAIRKPNGIILATGPTGSGKTTTLYSILKELNSPEKNIITLEDPVEYTLPGVNQVQVNTKSGFSFAGGLRSVLRQDPDIIMVGEIRDAETARIAVQSAMTGHLVLSTLHTNSAAATLVRLIDMGIEPFLVASSVEAIIAQRLVRAICPECREAYEIKESVRAKLGLNQENPARGYYESLGFDLEKPALSLYRAKGCPACNHSGYQGRLPLQEVLGLTEQIRDLINIKAPAEQMETMARKQGMLGLREDGIIKCLQGLTTIEEVMRTVFIDSI